MLKIKKIKPPYFIFAGALILVAGFFLWFAIVPFGKINYQTDFGGNYFFGGRGFIEKFSPVDRVDSRAEENSLRIIGDPVYFSLFTPRTFDRAKLTITYENKLSNQTPIIEAGVLTDKLVWQHQLRPLENKLIDGLHDWELGSSGPAVSYCNKSNQSETSAVKFNFCSYAPQTLVTYNYRLVCPFKILDYQPSFDQHGFPTPIRSDWQIYTYIKNEDLSWTVSVRDLNRNRNLGGDPAELGVYDQAGNKIFTSLLADDGVIEDSGVESQSRLVKAKLKNLPEGVYRVVLKTNDDIVSEVYTTQSKIVFINRIWPFLEVDKDSSDRILVIYSDAARVKARTINPAARQTIFFGWQSTEIKEPYFPFEILSPRQGNDLNSLIINRPDLLVEANGLFSFTPDAFFRAEPWRLDRDTDLNNFACLLADYQAPNKTDEETVATAEFDLKSAYREKGLYSFMISIPGLRSDDGQDDYLQIKKIKIELEGRTLFEKLKELLSK